MSFPLIACTSMRAVNTAEPAEQLQKDVRVGDTIEVTQAGGVPQLLKVTALDGGLITGTDAQGRSVQVAPTKLSALEVREVSAAKTTGAVLGTAGVLLLAFGAILVAAIVHAL
ncbi:MAG: hypothetical protein REI12_09505 [Pedobacter sp.]|nr:hypothetical protein [Pedobacter sp.]